MLDSAGKWCFVAPSGDEEMLWERKYTVEQSERRQDVNYNNNGTNTGKE